MGTSEDRSLPEEVTELASTMIDEPLLRLPSRGVFMRMEEGVFTEVCEDRGSPRAQLTSLCASPAVCSIATPRSGSNFSSLHMASCTVEIQKQLTDTQARLSIVE